MSSQAPNSMLEFLRSTMDPVANALPRPHARQRWQDCERR